MKAEGHPTLNNVCFLDIGTGKRFLTKSTMKSARKEQIDGVEYFVVARDVTMDSHPAYTGEKRLVDTAGRVWSSAGDGVHIFSPDGSRVGKILVPEAPANLCFGGETGKTLFITSGNHLWSVPLK